MTQAVTARSQNILYTPLSLEQKFKEKKDLLKNNPVEYGQFLEKCRNCKFKFEQIQKSHFGTDKRYEAAQEQLSVLFDKMERLVPQPEKGFVWQGKRGTVWESKCEDDVYQLKMAELFKNHRSQEAIEAFEIFEKNLPACAEYMYKDLWKLKGSPENVDRKELFYSALDSERAWVITENGCWVSKYGRKRVYGGPEVPLQQIGDAFLENEPDKAFPMFEEFSLAYPNVADSIYRKTSKLYITRVKDHALNQLESMDKGRVVFHKLPPPPDPTFKYYYWQFHFDVLQAELKVFPDKLANLDFMREQNIERLNRRCVEVANETVGLFKKGEYVSRNGQKHDLKSYLAFSTVNSRLYREAAPGPKQPRFAHTTLEVRAQNCVEMAYDLSFHGGNVLLLNLTSNGAFGGGYLKARGTWEEEICRCTGLAAAVDTKHGVQQEEFYPLDETAGSAGGLYTPQVAIIRMGMQNDYQFYDEPMAVAIASFAAYDKPNLDYTDPNDPQLQGDELKWTSEKIRTIYQCAYDNGHDTLILGPLGCDDSANPPAHLVKLFVDIHKREFNGCFKYVGFAVMVEMNDGKRHNPEGNYKPFARAVQQIGGQAYNVREAPPRNFIDIDAELLTLTSALSVNKPHIKTTTQ